MIKAEIRDAAYNHDEYPLSSDYDNIKRAKEWLPSLLNVFMEHVVGSELKQVAVSQAIVQAARPKSVISPILFGLGVSVDHSFGSKWLLDSLSRFGFSVSYDEVNLYKQSVVQSQIPDLPQSYPDSFTQWSADNVDHNVVTLDGSNTFHGMGIISMSTPFNTSHLEKGSFLELPVQRISRVKSADLVRNKSIPIIFYTLHEKSGLSLLKFKPISHLAFPYVLPRSLDLHVVWDFGVACADEQHLRPNWSGFMQLLSSSSNPFQPSADIRLLPIIDLNPNDMSCMYSTLLFIEKKPGN